MSVSPPTLVRTVSSDSLYAPSGEEDVDTTYYPTVVAAEADAPTIGAYEDPSLNASFYDPYKCALEHPAQLTSQDQVAPSHVAAAARRARGPVRRKDQARCQHPQGHRDRDWHDPA